MINLRMHSPVNKNAVIYSLEISKFLKFYTNQSERRVRIWYQRTLDIPRKLYTSFCQKLNGLLGKFLCFEIPKYTPLYPPRAGGGDF